MWLVTFHGGKSKNGKDTGATCVNNVFAYDNDWNLLSKAALDMGTSELELCELRGMALDAQSRLYVVNAYKELNHVIRFLPIADISKPAATSLFVFDRVFAQGHNASLEQRANSIFHPFAICFDSGNTAFISSQDTNVVTWLRSNGQTREVAPYLTKNYSGKFLDGTFAASSIGALHRIMHTPPDVPTPQGLDVTLQSGRPRHSVRGIAWHDERLYVADEPADEIKVYRSTTGELEHKIYCGKNSAPVHLTLAGDYLYAGCSGNGNVQRIHLHDSGQGNARAFPTGLKKLSAIAISTDGLLYCGCREPKKNEYQTVYRSKLPVDQWKHEKVKFDSITPGTVWNDVPEFFFHVNFDSADRF